MATKNIVPNGNGEGGIGVTGKRWNTGFINTITGNLTGNVTGNTSGTAATVTGAAQSNITSLGNLTTLTVDDITINGSTISDAGDLLFDIGGDISLDAAGGDFIFLVGGSQYGKINFLGTNNLTISGSVADHSGLSFATHAILPAEVSATTDGTIDLGASSEQFKSIFLSGGVVVANDGTIGSAGTANAISITSGGEVEFTGGNHISGASSLRAQAKSGNLFLDTSASAQIRTNGTTTALTLDASQNATFASKVHLSAYAGTALDPNLLITNSGSGAYNHVIDMLAPNLNSGEQAVITLGKSGNTGNTGIIGFKYNGANSDNSYIALGGWGKGDQFTFKNNGDQTITNGNLIIGTAGKGISFSATSDGGTTTPSELLDDYEEGTWTGTQVNDGEGLSNTGSYTRIGNTVFFKIYIGGTTSSAGLASITGLPYTANSSNGYNIFSYVHGSSLANSRGGYISGTTLIPLTNGGTGGVDWVVGGVISMFSGTYTI